MTEQPSSPPPPVSGADGAAGSGSASTASRGGAWRTLALALRPRVTRAQALTGVLCVLLGFAIAVQVQQTGTASLATMRESELVSLLDQTTRQADELQQQAAELERTHQELQSGSTSRDAALEAATRSAAAQGILSGRLPAEGPGVTITISDPAGAVSALTMLNLLEELRNAGAEAIQLNDLRLTASSYVLGTDDGLKVDSSSVAPPYRWVAIGDADTIATALAIPGGALAKVQIDGGDASVSTEHLVQVTAIRSVPDPQFATPRPAEVD